MELNLWGDRTSAYVTQNIWRVSRYSLLIHRLKVIISPPLLDCHRQTRVLVGSDRLGLGIDKRHSDTVLAQDGKASDLKWIQDLHCKTKPLCKEQRHEVTRLVDG